MLGEHPQSLRTGVGLPVRFKSGTGHDSEHVAKWFIVTVVVGCRQRADQAADCSTMSCVASLNTATNSFTSLRLIDTVAVSVRAALGPLLVTRIVNNTDDTDSRIRQFTRLREWNVSDEETTGGRRACGS